MCVLLGPCQYFWCYRILATPCNPLIARRLANLHHRDAVKTVALHHIANRVGAVVTGSYHNRVGVQSEVSNAPLVE